MGLETKVEGTAAKPSGHGDGSVSIGLHVQVLLGGMNKTQKWVRKGYRKGHGKGDRKGYRKVLFSFFFPSGIPEYCWMIPMEVLCLKRRL